MEKEEKGWYNVHEVDMIPARSEAKWPSKAERYHVGDMV